MVAVQRWKLKIKTVKSMVFYFKKVKKKTTNDDGKKTNLKQIDQMLVVVDRIRSIKNVRVDLQYM